MIDFSGISTHRSRIAAAGIVVLLAGGFTLGSYIPKVEAMRRIDGARRGPGGEGSGNLASRQDDIERRLAAVREKIPPEDGSAPFREKMLALGKSHHLEIADIRIQRMEASGGIIPSETIVSFRGKARDVCEFIDAMKRIDRLVGIGRLVAAVGNDGSLAVQAHFATYSEARSDVQER